MLRVMVMGILTIISALQLERFLREVHYKIVIFCRFIENNFFGSLLLRDDPKIFFFNLHFLVMMRI
jgi:hypothetical protein